MSIKSTLASLATFLVLFGCASTVTHPSPAKDLGQGASAEPAPYRIGTGDDLEIKFFFTPELNDRVQVRPDGKISLMFVQDIQAAGQTPEELASAIKEKLAPHIKQSDLVVTISSFGSQKAYVGGEVAKPGPIQLAGPQTLLQVLTDAGWMTPAANHDEVVLVRRAPDGKEGVYPLNISKITSGQDMSQNIMVQAGDFILVPPSGSVSFDRWIDQNVRQAVPFGMSTGYFFNSSSTSIFR